jgi:acyl-CoA synthetase (AMP-forming)/AMP-acid ligase II
VEEGALGMPELVAAAAVGVPDPEAGEAITLFVTPRADTAVSPQQVAAFCARSLPRYLVPQRVLVVDALPLNANGKVVKSRLRQIALATESTVGRTTDARAVGGGLAG